MLCSNVSGAYLIQPLLHDAREPVGSPVSYQTMRLDALRNLAVLRVVAPVLQLVSVWVVEVNFGIQTFSPLLAAVFGVQLQVAVVTWIYVLRRPLVRESQLLANGLLDILMFSTVLYFTGGASNPFAILVVLHYMIIATALDGQGVVLVAAFAVICHLLLALLAPEIQHPDGLAATQALHARGSVVSFVLAAALLTFFVNRMNAALRHNEHAVRKALERQTRNESVSAMGAMAAGYAHELSSPLGTVTLLVDGLRARHPLGRDAADLRKIEEQVRRCKDIISNLAQAGGQRRSESAGAIRADRFVLCVLNRVRDLHAGATLIPRLDPSPPPLIVGEETLRQAITSVVENAVQASPHHVLVQTDWSADQLLIIVRDQGPGFPAEILQQFGLTVRTTRKDAGGNGMGLFLAAATLDYLNGRLTVRNEPQGGASVTLAVPLATIGLSVHLPTTA